MTTPISDRSRDDTGWLFQDGVRSWVDTGPDGTHGVSTLTVVAPDPPTLAGLLAVSVPGLERGETQLFRWHTLGRPLVGTAMGVRRLRSDLTARLAGFGEPFVDFEDPSQIPTTTARLKPPLTLLHIEASTDHVRTALLLSGDTALTEQRIAACLRPYAVGLSDRTIGAAAEDADREIACVLARFYDDRCTYCAVDFFGAGGRLRPLINALEERDVVRLTPDDVPAFLRSAARR